MLVDVEWGLVWRSTSPAEGTSQSFLSHQQHPRRFLGAISQPLFKMGNWWIPYFQPKKNNLRSWEGCWCALLHPNSSLKTIACGWLWAASTSPGHFEFWEKDLFTTCRLSPCQLQLSLIFNTFPTSLGLRYNERSFKGFGRQWSSVQFHLPGHIVQSYLSGLD